MKISAKSYLGHGRLRVLAAVALALAACETQTPVGPTGVTLTTTVPTTSVPGTIGTTSTSTTSISLATVRSYISFGQVAANVPSALTIVLQPLSGRPTAASLLDKLPLFEKQVDPIFWTVSGFYVTPGGGAGQVLGQFQGTLDDGIFTGSLTNETPECTAQREFGGTVDPQFLRWSGGRTLNDCKGSPLSFNSLTMGATNAPPPTTTIGATSTTTTPVSCAFSLSTTGVSVESGGGQRSVGITTGPTCNWTVQNFVEWITAQPTAGTGPSNVNLTIAPNPGAPRSATIIIAGLPLVVNQGQVTTTTTTSTPTTVPTTVPTTSTSTSSTTSTTTSSIPPGSTTTSTTTSTSTSTTTSSTTSTTSTTTSTSTIPTTTSSSTTTSIGVVVGAGARKPPG